MNSSFGILASGNLGYQCIIYLNKFFNLEFIYTDSKSEEIINYSLINEIPIFIGNPRNGKSKNFVENFKVDYLISINYLFIIENDLICFPDKLAINIHGSLLPKYRGRAPHIWAIINNEIKTGITAHILAEFCDQGDIIYQESIVIDKETTGNDLLNIYLKLYPIFIHKVINMLQAGDLKLLKQDEALATWYNKRSPNDGQISWDWQKERIYNWVRALSDPYPGAFTFYNNEMIIIDKIEYSDFGFSQDVENGTVIVGGRQPIVKTPNGAIKVLKLRDQLKIFKKGSIFYEKH